MNLQHAAPPSAEGVDRGLPANPAESAAQSVDGRAEALERELLARDARIAELERALKARDDFLSVAAHELSNPMHALSMQLALITRIMKGRGDRAPVDDELAARIDLVHDTLRRYVARTTLLLDVSRVMDGMHHLERVEVDLREVVRQAMALYRSKAAHHRVDLQLHCESALIGHWDRMAMEQIVENLLSNAIKFGAGAPVVVRGHSTDSGHVRLSVSDKGVGISRTDQGRIFAKFEKAVASSYAHGGFGVGLWLVRNLVEAHGGTIEVDSTPGEGSVFVVVLPVAAAGQGATGRAARVGGVDAPPAADAPAGFGKGRTA